MTSTDDARPAPRPVDLDMLADHLAGVLSGDTAREVAALVAQDPAWARTLVELRRADANVRDSLDAYGLAAGPMPESVFDRIMAALPATGNPADAPVVTVPATAVPGGAAVIPLFRAGDRPNGKIRDSRPRRSQPAVWLATAAAVVVAVCTGLVIHGNTTSVVTGAEPMSGKDGVAAAAPSTRTIGPLSSNGTDAGPIPVSRLGASGVHYTQATLGQSDVVPAAPGANHPLELGTPVLPDGAVPSALSRLDNRTDLSACLQAVLLMHAGGAPVSVDFAYYLDQPALILTLQGMGITVAVGPDCGLPGEGAAEIATAPTH